MEELKIGKFRFLFVEYNSLLIYDEECILLLQIILNICRKIQIELQFLKLPISVSIITIIYFLLIMSHGAKYVFVNQNHRSSAN